MSDHMRRYQSEYKVDYLFNSLLAVIGVGMAAFSVVMIILTHSACAWSFQLLPHFSLYGCVGVMGCGLSVLSIKWIVQSCKKNIAYKRAIREGNEK